MTFNLFDDHSWFTLRPLTYTRPVADLRIGILRIAEKWEKFLSGEAGYLTHPYLNRKYPLLVSEWYINGAVCPDEILVDKIKRLECGEVLLQGALVLAYRSETVIGPEEATKCLKPKDVRVESLRLRYPEDIFTYNDQELRKDFTLLTKGRSSAPISSSNALLGEDIFLEEGAQVECSTLNSRFGPIYLGKSAEIWEGSHIRGAFALCDHAQVKMGAKIYGKTTIGPYSRVGGEINNSVIWGYSSKGHEGYLGNSVIGQWCNLGADTNNSNLKNNYKEVKLWDYEQESFRSTGLLFCGLIMGDHTKTAINTMFNTGTVCGVASNVFGAGFPPVHVPDFSWGGVQGMEVYALDKMLETAEEVMKRRNIPLDEIEKAILTNVFEWTKAYRKFES